MSSNQRSRPDEIQTSKPNTLTNMSQSTACVVSGNVVITCFSLTQLCFSLLSCLFPWLHILLLPGPLLPLPTWLLPAHARPDQLLALPSHHNHWQARSYEPSPVQEWVYSLSKVLIAPYFPMSGHDCPYNAISSVGVMKSPNYPGQFPVRLL